MTTPMSEEKKAKDCPGCNGSPELTHSGAYARCANLECCFYGPLFRLEKWNTRPREQALEAEIAELESELGAAADLTGCDKSVDEVMLAISDAVADFMPDCESPNAGTLAERVEAAADMGRRAAKLEEALREAKNVLAFYAGNFPNDDLGAWQERINEDEGDKARDFIFKHSSLL